MTFTCLSDSNDDLRYQQHIIASNVQMKKKWALGGRGSLPRVTVLPGQIRQKPQYVSSSVPLAPREHPIGNFRMPKAVQASHFDPDFLDLCTFILKTFELRMDSKIVCNP